MRSATAYHSTPGRFVVLLWTAAVLTLWTATAVAQPRGLQVRVTLPADTGSPQALSGRLIIFMSDAAAPADVLLPDFIPDGHLWMAAREVTALAPGATAVIDGTAAADPTPLPRAPRGRYQLMALLDVDHNVNYVPLSPADYYSTVVQVGDLDPGADTTIDVQLTRRPPAVSAKLRPEAEPIDVVSDALTAFAGQPVHMRAVVVLPPGYRGSRQRYPTVFMTHGFGGLLDRDAPGTVSRLATQMASGKLPPMIWVLLDQAVPGGTHEFADSANNGPWGQALTRELIPYLEKRYRMDGRPSGRLLNGHSSGGWATMWMQVTYPDIFGGTWSTSPDPLDFHEFTNVDLYANTNFYRTRSGEPIILIRGVEGAGATMETFAKREAVLGDIGGQMASFEWVFSRRGANGRPVQLFDRATGAIDRAVADDWIQRFDVTRRLVTNAATLAPQLRDRLHVIVGTADTFHLDVAVRRAEAALKALPAVTDYRARFTYLEGRNHFNLYDGDLLSRIATQMYAVARPRSSWRPSLTPASPELTR